MPTTPPSPDLFEHTTMSGTKLIIQRSPTGSLRYIVSLGPTDPDTHKFPVADLDAAEFRLLLEADRTQSLSFIANSLSEDEEQAIPASIASLAYEMDPHKENSFASKLLEAVASR
jgi:hypothetical protein